MLPFDDFSQQYTSLLIYLITFSIFTYGSAKLFYYLYSISKLDKGDKKRIEEHSRKKNEEYKKKMRRRTKWVNKHVYRGKLPEVPEEFYEPIDEFSEKTTSIMIVLKKIIFNYPSWGLLLISGTFLLTILEIVIRSILNLFTHPDVPIELKLLIIPPIGMLSLIALSGIYIGNTSRSSDAEAN